MNEPELRNATLVFLIKRSEEGVSNICLAMKKRGFGMNRWNGVGGKVIAEETIEEAAKREAREEIGVSVNDLQKIAELSFYFPHNPAWDQRVHVYFSETWEGEPAESEEMNPKWFSFDEIPFENMWPDDIFWLPEVIKGKMLKAMFKFGENDIVEDKEINIIEGF
ncbi:MAG: 8-oxo-dGTP diphosphatase [Patescibacteria group bacterium]|nr:8-oxo-dGTP diphosphatase [Patescibacteria group bacterium]MCL5262083.1 8-oxo-dGTP diphosphatase [Patescibacteria group bacterium]